MKKQNVSSKVTLQKITEFQNEKDKYFVKEFYDNIKLCLKENKNITYQTIIDILEKSIDDIHKINPHKKTLGPKPNTLEMNNLDKKEPINILENYTVTDKAEGEGKTLYILGIKHL